MRIHLLNSSCQRGRVRLAELIKMKKLLLFFASLAFLAPATTLGGNTAEIRLHCYSLRFQPATAKLFGQTYVLEITGNPSSAAANGELRLMPLEIPYTHGGIFLLQFPFDPTPVPLPFYLDTPFADADDNGLIDDFEVSRGISGTTTGVYDDFAFGESPFQATWNRAANSKDGTCRLAFPDLGLTFNHTFEVIEYAGTLFLHQRRREHQRHCANDPGAKRGQQVGGTLALTKENANLLPVIPVHGRIVQRNPGLSGERSGANPDQLPGLFVLR